MHEFNAEQGFLMLRLEGSVLSSEGQRMGFIPCRRPKKLGRATEIGTQKTREMDWAQGLGVRKGKELAREAWTEL